MGCCEGEEPEEEVTQEVILKSRSCTDVPCLVLFVLFWGFSIFIAAFALVYGNPYLLINGYDSFGNICGTTNEPFGEMSWSGLDMTEKPYVFYWNVHGSLWNSTSICVSKCPDRDLNSLDDIIDFYEETGSLLLRYDALITQVPLYKNKTLFPECSDTAAIVPQFGICPKLPIYESVSIGSRCIPGKTASIAAELVYDFYGYLNNVDTMQQAITGLYIFWPHILGFMFLAAGNNLLLGAILVVSFVTLMLLFLVAGIVSWLILLAVCAAAIACTSIFWWTYADVKTSLDSTPSNQILMSSVKNERTFLSLAIISTVFTVILVAVCVCLRTKVSVLVKLFREAGECLRSIPALFLQPLLTMCCLFAFFTYWVVILLFLATTEQAKQVKIHTWSSNLYNISGYEDAVVSKEDLMKSSKDAGFYVIKWDDRKWVHSMWWMHVLNLLWTSEVILASQQMVIAGAVASWYFSRDGGKECCAMSSSFRRLIMYHVGTVSLGSVLILIFKIPRLLLQMLQKRAKQSGRCAECLNACCVCCLKTFEKCIRYMNHNAFTITAIQGISFCPAAKQAFFTLSENALQVANINSLGDFVLFLTKVFVSIFVGFIAVITMKNSEDPIVYSIPVVVVFLFSYLIAHCFTTVFEMVFDTLYMCYCEDYRLYGTREPDKMSPELRNILLPPRKDSEELTVTHL